MIALVLATALQCGASATQIDLDECAAADDARASARERIAYDRARQRMPANALLALGEARWRAARDATCDYYAFDDGSMRPMLFSQCRANAALARARTLAQQRPEPGVAAPAAAAREEARIYGLLEIRLTPAERTLLARSETLWLRYAKIACLRAAAPCASDLFAARTQELKDSWLADPFW